MFYFEKLYKIVTLFLFATVLFCLLQLLNRNQRASVTIFCHVALILPLHFSFCSVIYSSILCLSQMFSLNGSHFMTHVVLQLFFKWKINWKINNYSVNQSCYRLCQIGNITMLVRREEREAAAVIFYFSLHTKWFTVTHGWFLIVHVIYVAGCGQGWISVLLQVSRWD